VGSRHRDPPVSCGPAQRERRRSCRRCHQQAPRPRSGSAGGHHRRRRRRPAAAAAAIARRGRSARRSCASAAAAAAPAAAAAAAAAAATRRPRPSAPAAVSYLASRRCPTRAPAGTGTSSRGGRAVLCRSGVASPRPPVVCGPAQWEWRRHRAAAATAVPALSSTEWSRRSSPFLRPASVVMRGAVRPAGATRRRMWPRARCTRDASSPPAGGTLCSAPPISSKGHHGGAPPVFSQRAVCACSVARGCWLMQPRRCVSKPVSCSCSARAARCQ
jgi:hypothetical protein